MAIKFSCYSCSNELSFETSPGRSESCPKCNADVKVCLNCTHYDLKSYNSCKEPSAERVVDKDKRNFCDYFLARTGSFSSSISSAEEALKKLDDLFK